MERWIAKVFVSAVVRRVAALLVLALLAWLGIGSARAQSTESVDQGQAYSKCISDAAGYFAQYSEQLGWNTYWCAHTPPGNQPAYIACAGVTQGACSNYRGYHYYQPGKTCASRPSASTLFLPPGGSTRCNDGCEQKYTWMGANSEGKETTRTDYTGSVCNPDKQKDECNAKNPGGTTPPSWAWNGYLGVCQPIATECNPGQTATPDGKCKNNDECPISHVLNASDVCVKKEEQCPPGNVKSPEGNCLPGDGQCAAGEALGKDGTCKRDTDGDGVPDSDQDPDDPNNNDDGKQFSGGDTCNSPPTCSGDPILCGQSRIQWRIDCNTRSRANIEGGACDRIPVCSGDGCKPMEHAQLIQQWKAACALERMAKGGQGGGNPVPGDGDGLKEHLTAMKQAEVDALNALGTDDGHTGVDESKIWKTFGNGDFNPNLFGGSGGGQCSFNLELMGHSIDPGPGFWTLAGMIGWLVVACAYLWVAFKLGG